MNVLNDNQPKESTPSLDPIQVLTLMLFGGAAICTFILAPLPLLLAQSRLPEPWPKIVAIGAAVIALMVLEAPAPWVVVAFGLGIVFADQIARDKGVWLSMAVAVVSATGLAAGVFLLQAYQNHAEPLAYWQALVHSTVGQVRTPLESKVQMDWAVFETTLVEQGPFFLVALNLVSVWISLGAAAHFNWLDPAKRLSGAFLRQAFRVPEWLLALSVVLVALSALWNLPFYVGGTARVLGCLLFIQGTVCLSDVLCRRGAASSTRLVAYFLSMVFGFYALMALGMISPWYFRAVQKVPGRVLKEKETP